CARENNPIAKKLLIDRGLTEGDLTKPLAMSLVRDLMKKAEQRDEVESNDLLTILSDGSFTEAGTRLLKAIGNSAGARKDQVKDWAAEKFAAVKDQIREPIAYVPGAWAPPPADLGPANWERAKSGAVANGLYDEKTGIGAALQRLAAALPAAEAA